MGDSVKKIDPSIIDLLHIDVMDGRFVPNLTIGPGYIKNLKTHTEIPLDIHLMIEKPGDSIKEYIDLNPWAITFHYESTRFSPRLLKVIRDSSIKAGLAVVPSTPVESVFDILPYMDMVLVMSVDPGFYGQPFMENSLSRIRRLRDFTKAEGLDVLIQVDGGINAENIAKVVSAGADVIVAGNSAFRGGDPNSSVKELKKLALL
jgi:ribulose-phosphate 3-epimerase